MIAELQLASALDDSDRAAEPAATHCTAYGEAEVEATAAVELHRSSHRHW